MLKKGGDEGANPSTLALGSSSTVERPPDTRLVVGSIPTFPTRNEIKQDLFLEEEQNLKEELFKCFKNELERRCTRHFPEWYKDKLLGSALPQSNDNQEPEAILGNNENNRATNEG